MTRVAPLPCRFTPVGAQQRVGLLHQLRQRFVRLGAAPVQILRHRGVTIQVIQLRPQRLRIGNYAVAHYDARRLHKPRFDRVVEAEVRDDPVEQLLLPVFGDAGSSEDLVESRLIVLVG